MDFAETAGFIAAGFVLATFMMRTMLPLRIFGVAGNIAFITYGWLDDLTPVLLLHAILLPVNLYRLFEMYRLIRAVRDKASAVSDLGWLLPYSKSVAFKAGEAVFRKNDDAESMYIVASGRVRLEELDVDLGPDEVLGEIGLFSLSTAEQNPAIGRRKSRPLC